MDKSGFKATATVLVVDDNPKNLQVLGGLLKKEGMEVEFATNGKAALNWLEKKGFDLVLLDIMMPVMDGYEVCTAIKANPLYNGTPIIFITAKTDTESIIKGFDCGGVGYITKPFIPNELIARVWSQISIKKSQEKIVLYLKEIEHKNKNIRSSIEYARNIQRAVLKNSPSKMTQYPEHFILFMPKDIVSGDFYWYFNVGDTFIMAVMDCTGHGVPGAFMSILGTTLLNDIVLHDGITAPDVILEHLRIRLIDTLGQNEELMTIKDGIDGIIVKYDPAKNLLSFAGSYNPLVHIHDHRLEKIKTDRIPIGYYESFKKFNLYTIPIVKGDLVYISSDGYIDQFGGIERRKLLFSGYSGQLERIHGMDMEGQKKELREFIENWRGENEQTDDIIIVGLKF